eukprot:5400177-Amphidinium_carterae.1
MSDVLTKPMTGEVFWHHMEEMHLCQTEGRAERAPTVTVDLEKLNNASRLLALLWLGWRPAAEATEVEEGQRSISLTIMLRFFRAARRR